MKILRAFDRRRSSHWPMDLEFEYRLRIGICGQHKIQRQACGCAKKYSYLRGVV